MEKISMVLLMNQIFEKLLMICSIDVKMTLTTLSTNEIPHHPGLIYTMTQMTNNPVILMITPSIILDLKRYRKC
ncbi:unnamed protein product [Rotaria sordida]|uniref:Uncharacterized protein n=1 Tax=Rotaria sordida TaxID=392033 RepID=A0A820HZK4_9BILA|nr:unnamed protein product [Rotaria sordida]